MFLKIALHRYCDEFNFRWDERKATDGKGRLRQLKEVKESGWFIAGTYNGKESSDLWRQSESLG